MDRFMTEIIDEHVPKVNPAIMNGLATVFIPLAPAYIDTVFRSASKGFPVGLEYVSYERCTPQEEHAIITRPKNNKRTYDLGRSDIFLVKYFFKFNGEDLPPRYMYLPFVGPGGIIYLGGSMFHLSPVMTDKVISPGFNSVFVRLLRDKVNFERCSHTIIINGVAETRSIVWSQLHRKPPNANKMPPTTKAKPSVVHYLLGKYGFAEMFQKYAGFVPIIGEDEINEHTYPRDRYVICESTQIQLKTCIGNFYDATRIKVAVPVEYWNDFTSSLVAGFYYVVDHFPSYVKARYVNDNKNWMILLGHIIHNGAYGAGKLYEQVNEHYSSLDQYVDSIIVLKLKEIGYEADIFYDLLALIVKHFNFWITESSENVTSLFGKTLEVLYYALYDVTAAIFKTNFKLNKLASKKVLTSKEIIETMNKQLKIGAVFGLTRANIAMSSVSYCGDNMYAKITSVVAQQLNISGVTRGKKSRTIIDETKRFDASMLEVGSLLFLSKSNPTPAVRASMHMNIDLATGTILPKPQFAAARQEITDKMKNST
jgi:hypothetical protein